MQISHESPTDASRWQAWLRAQGEVFFLYARQQTRSEADAKDVFQDALVEAWRKCEGETPDKAMVLATIRRRAIDLGRSMDRRTVREQRVCGEAVQWFVADYAEGDTREFLRGAIGGLPEALREVLILRVWGDLSFPAIASLTNVPLATATSRYRYALERLRGVLTELKP